MKRALLRAAVVLTAVLVGGSIAAGSASASPSIVQRFSVPSPDNCTYGYTQGHLEWRTPVPTSVVRVTGEIVDRPSPTDPTAVCRDDGRYTRATYVAYSGNLLVDQAVTRVDNGAARFDFVLGVNSSVRGVDRVVIQVCRLSLASPSPTPDYCSRQYTYTPSAAGLPVAA